MSRVIGVFSGKGGVGKTTLTANLGASLSKDFKKNVVIFDSNLHSSHLGLHFGLYDDLPVTLREVLRKRMPALQAVYVHPQTGVRIIPAPLNGDGLNLTKERCVYLVNQVRKNYDVVILDCAPGLGKEVLVPMQSVDEAIVITTPDIAAVTDAMKTVELLKRFKKNVLGIVVNRCSRQRYELTPQEIESTTNYSILKTVSEDSKVPESISRGLPVTLAYPHSKASIQLKQFAASLVNEEYNETSLLDKIKNIFSFRASKPLQIGTEQVALVPAMEKEVSDLTELKSDLDMDVKEELKQEIMKRVRQKLKERMYES